jgi:hypothetical protein
MTHVVSRTAGWMLTACSCADPSESISQLEGSADSREDPTHFDTPEAANQSKFSIAVLSFSRLGASYPSKASLSSDRL